MESKTKQSKNKKFPARFLFFDRGTIDCRGYKNLKSLLIVLSGTWWWFTRGGDDVPGTVFTFIINMLSVWLTFCLQGKPSFNLIGPLSFIVENAPYLSTNLSVSCIPQAELMFTYSLKGTEFHFFQHIYIWSPWKSFQWL